MQSCLANAEVLTQMGLELAEYERIIGNIDESAMDTRRLGESLHQIRALFKANFVTLILRVQDEPLLSPMIVALPFKLMMFVLVDGWLLVMGTLATSYGVGT